MYLCILFSEYENKHVIYDKVGKPIEVHPLNIPLSSKIHIYLYMKQTILGK
jgi:hypothetical protein